MAPRAIIIISRRNCILCFPLLESRGGNTRTYTCKHNCVRHSRCILPAPARRPREPGNYYTYFIGRSCPSDDVGFARVRVCHVYIKYGTCRVVWMAARSCRRRFDECVSGGFIFIIIFRFFFSFVRPFGVTLRTTCRRPFSGHFDVEKETNFLRDTDVVNVFIVRVVGVFRFGEQRFWTKVKKKPYATSSARLGCVRPFPKLDFTYEFNNTKHALHGYRPRSSTAIGFQNKHDSTCIQERVPYARG